MLWWSVLCVGVCVWCIKRQCDDIVKLSASLMWCTCMDGARQRTTAEAMDVRLPLSPSSPLSHRGLWCLSSRWWCYACLSCVCLCCFRAPAKDAAQESSSSLTELASTVQRMEPFICGKHELPSKATSWVRYGSIGTLLATGVVFLLQLLLMHKKRLNWPSVKELLGSVVVAQQVESLE